MKNTLKDNLIYKKPNKSTKNILIISPCFTGGGLEVKINSTIDKFHKEYNFSLLTKTPVEDMKIKPSKNLQKIYDWAQQAEAMENNDILSIHPFNALNELADIPFNKKIIYTLHGEASLIEDFSVFGRYIDIFYSVSDKVTELFNKQYPLYSIKIKLLKNYFSGDFKEIESNTPNSKNILFSITNGSNWNYLNEIIKRIPNSYTIHIIGHIPAKQYEHKNVIYDGFVDVEKYISQHNFDFAFSRGGFSAMELISKNIPTVLIYDRMEKIYLELVTKDNFMQLSNQNFVTWKESTFDIIKLLIRKLEKSKNEYAISNLLKQTNDITLMPDPYKQVVDTVQIIYAFNKAYVNKFLLTLDYLINNSKSYILYNIQILTENIDDNDKIFLRNYVSKNKNFKIYFYDINKFDNIDSYIDELHLTNLLSECKQNERIVFWGASLFLENIIKKYQLQNIIGIIDKNEFQNNKYMGQYKICNPESIHTLNPDTVIISIVNNRKERAIEIKNYLQTINYNNQNIKTL